MATDTAIPGKKPERTNSRKRARRAPAVPLTAEQRRHQINAYYDLQKNSPALKAARINRMKRLNAAKWAAAQAQIPVQWQAIMVIFRVIIMSLVLFVMFRVMLAEKQILAVRNVLMGQRGNLHQSRVSWSAFQHAYETRNRRHPTENLKTWLDFAQDQLCEPVKLYNAIERDLAPFRRRLNTPTAGSPINLHPSLQDPQKPAPPTPEPLKLHWNELEAVATNYSKGAYLLVEIKNNKLTIVEKDLTEWYDQHPTVHNGKGVRAWLEERKLLYNLEWLMDPVINHKPPITTRFVINLHYQPKSPPNARVPIFSSHYHSFHTDGDPTHPGNMSLEVSNKNRNSVIDVRDEATRDLLIPHLYIAGGRMGAAGMTSSPAVGGFWFWPFFRDGKPWTQRKTAIAWRGSTLGNYEKNATGQHFFTGPRFELMKRWGGTQVHPFSDTVPVDADFAFTKLIVQGEGHIDRKQKEVIQNDFKKQYRTARRMSYRKMQQYKYLLDVDGLSFSVRFSALLRSGSLVFKTTRYREWFSERLRAWKDYIPVNYDTGDLADKLRWANSQPPEVITNIIRHARETVERHIRPEDMQCYTYRMILEYTTLFDESSFGPSVPPS